jgi:plasmid stabilization system protein ParE
MKLKVVITPAAEADIDSVYSYIVDVVFALMAALEYRIGIYDTINRLSTVGASIAVSQNLSLQVLYGHDVRTTTYKKMTIVYNIVDDVVLVRRVVAGSLIR